MNDNGLLKRLEHVQKGLFEIGERSWSLTIQDARGEIAKSAAEIARLSAQVERANKRFADILDCVDANAKRSGQLSEIEKIATRAMLECQGYPLTSDNRP